MHGIVYTHAKSHKSMDWSYEHLYSWAVPWSQWDSLCSWRLPYAAKNTYDTSDAI